MGPGAPAGPLRCDSNSFDPAAGSDITSLFSTPLCTLTACNCTLSVCGLLSVSVCGLLSVSVCGLLSVSVCGMLSVSMCGLLLTPESCLLLLLLSIANCAVDTYNDASLICPKYRHIGYVDGWRNQSHYRQSTSKLMRPSYILWLTATYKKSNVGHRSSPSLYTVHGFLICNRD